MTRDRVFLIHMLEEVRFLRSVSKGMRLASLLKDPVRQRAIVRSLEVLGEASKNLSEDFRHGHPGVDWSKIARLRDRLIHHYFGVDWRILWDIIRTKLPDLERDLETLIAEMSDE